MSLPLEEAAVDRLRDAQVHVVGLAGTEGAAIVRFLAARGVSDLHAHDIQAGVELKRSFMQVHVGFPKADREAVWREIEGLPIVLHTGADYLHGIDEADAIFASQGWYLYPANHPMLDRARESGTPFYGLMHLYFGLARARTLAVTGSNGKSTTSRLAEHILREGGKRVWYAGNERRSVQVLDRLEEMQPDDFLVLEVSNRHLIDLNPKPDIAVITNVLPNHLSEHGGSFDQYLATKRRLIELQSADQICILNADDPASQRLAKGAGGRVMWFSRTQRLQAGAWVEDGRIRLRPSHETSNSDARVKALDSGELDGEAPYGAAVDSGAVDSGIRDGEAPDGAALDSGAVDSDALDAGSVDAMPVPGEHNIENLLAAALAVWEAGVDPAEIEKAVPSFRGLRHRTQLVWSIDGVEYYDDLNATSPQATISALTALAPRPKEVHDGVPNGRIAGSRSELRSEHGPELGSEIQSELRSDLSSDLRPELGSELRSDRRIVLICGGEEKGLDMTSLGDAIARYVRWLILLPGPGSDAIERAVHASDRREEVRIGRFDDFAVAVKRVTQGALPGERVLLSPACPGFFSLNYGAAGSEVGFRALLREINRERVSPELQTPKSDQAMNGDGNDETSGNGPRNG